MIKDKKNTSIIRSSAAEYLTFVAASGKGGIEAVYADENIWLSQKMMAILYSIETHTINYHLKKIFADGELEESAVIRNFRITAADSDDHAGLGNTFEPLYRSNRPGNFAGCREGDSRNSQSSRRK